MIRLANLFAVVLGLLLNCASAQSNQTTRNDPFAEHLFPPELILQYQEEIGLADKQREAVMSAVQELQRTAPQATAQSEAERDKLSALLKKEQLDEQAVLAQLDKLQQLQAKQSAKHIQLMIQIKNQLNAEQQSKLAQFKKKGPGQFPPPSLKEKLDLLQSKIQDWVSSGHDPLPISELMQGFEPLLKSGKLKEADSLLTQALKLTEE